MDGVVSILDEVHYKQVEALWAEFEEKLGIEGVHQTPIPHFSYHVAKSYDTPRLEKLLRRVAADTEPFEVMTNGLGIFTGENPVLYVPVVRSYDLRTFHQRIWDAVSEYAHETSPHYHPDAWRPHITLAYGDMDHDELPEVIRLLSKRKFRWEISINNVALISSASEIDSVGFRIPFSAIS